VPTQSNDTSVSPTASAVLVVARTRVDCRDLVGVHVDADDLMTVGGKRRRRHAADISETKD
jgi:hypothetical protein